MALMSRTSVTELDPSQGRVHKHAEMALMPAALSFVEERTSLELRYQQEQEGVNLYYANKREELKTSIRQIRAKLKQDLAAGVIDEQEANEQRDLVSEKKHEDLRLWFARDNQLLKLQYDKEQKDLLIDLNANRILDEIYEAQKQKLELEKEDKRQALVLREKNKRRDLEVDEAEERERLRLEREKERQDLVLELENKRPKLDAGTVTSNPDITEFIDSLRSMELDKADVVFSLPNGGCLGGQSHLDFLGGKLYIRECYKRLRDMILGVVAAQAKAAKKKRCFVIQGNPGIGKSLFSYFMIYTLMKEGKTIIWEPARTETCICIKDDKSPPRVVAGYSGFLDELRDQSAWFIVDGHPPRAVNAYTLLVCSPNKDHWRDIEKRSSLMLYMPVWSWSEFETAHGLGLARSGPGSDLVDPELTLNAIREGFDKFGGIPRYVFEESSDKDGLEVRLTQAIESAELHHLTSLVGFTENPNTHSHKLLQMVVETKECRDGMKLRPFREYKIDFASRYIGLRVTTKLLLQQRADMVLFIMSNHGKPGAGSLCGTMFEGIAHGLLYAGGLFRARKLQAKAVKHGGVSQKDGQNGDAQGNDAVADPSSAIENIFFAKRERKTFKKLDNVTSESGLYWMPEAANFKSIDSLEFPDKLFQMTVSSNHPIKMKGLSDAMEALHKLQPAAPAAKKPKLDADVQRTVRLYFVVPEGMLDDFPMQTYKTAKGEDSANMPAAVKFVEQYVLEVPLTVPGTTSSSVSPSVTKSAGDQPSKA